MGDNSVANDDDTASDNSEVRANPKKLILLGSTGSIGTQTLDIVAGHPADFSVIGVAAVGNHPNVLAQQVQQFQVPRIAITDQRAAQSVRELLSHTTSSKVAVFTGPQAIVELIADCRDELTADDIILNALVGAAGLTPTLNALATGARLALANKESLVVGGSLVIDAARPGQIIPVDSEHSALAQCLRSGNAQEVAQLILTASGGPFFGWSEERLRTVTLEQALHHPTWQMGQMNTLNSATLVNKGLELIEAQLLFGVSYERIQVTVHRQSIVHSMVTFIDGSTIAQASPPSMRIPIALALGWPSRIPHVITPCDFTGAQQWTFEPINSAVFPAIALARQAGSSSGFGPAIYNAANEIAVASFIAGNITFPMIVRIIEQVLDTADQFHGFPDSVSEVLAADRWAREQATGMIRTISL